MNESPPTLLDAIRAHKALVVLCGVATGILIGLLTYARTPAFTVLGSLGLVYPSTGNVLLPNPQGDATMARYVSQRALFAKSDVVLQAASDELPVATLSGLRGDLAVVPSSNANVILFTVTGGSADGVATTAEAVMASYRAETLKDVQTRAKAQADAWREAGDEARAKLVESEGAAFGDGVEFVVSPRSENAQGRSFVNKEAVLGVIVGLGLGAGLAWLGEDAKYRRRTRPGPRVTTAD